MNPMTDITVPTLGESPSPKPPLAQWLKVSEGDAVKKDDVLVELETDKVSVEVRRRRRHPVAKSLAQPKATPWKSAPCWAEMGEGGLQAARSLTPRMKSCGVRETGLQV
jgi:2-oxoglutarate dehydrogenase E2 component (dihydrolipoamide succinyltransferase)